MILALSTGHEIGLAVAGAVFILYALASAVVLPRRYPGFPGRYRTQHIAVSALLFVAVIAALLVFGRSTTSHHSKIGTELPQQVAAAGGGAVGDAVAGKKVFTVATCNTCHTFKAAGSKANLGPDLDNLASYAQKAGYTDLAYFTRAAIVAPPAPYVPPGYTRTPMPIDYGHSLSQTDIDNVIAFLLANQPKHS